MPAKTPDTKRKPAKKKRARKAASDASKRQRLSPPSKASKAAGRADLLRVLQEQMGMSERSLERLSVPELREKLKSARRAKFPLGAKVNPNLAQVVTFAAYPEQIRTLNRLVKISRQRGGRLTRSQALRWAIDNAPWEELPDL